MEKKSATVLKLVQKNAVMKILQSGEVSVLAPDFDMGCRAMQAGLTRIEGCLVFVNLPVTQAAAKKKSAPKASAAAAGRVSDQSHASSAAMEPPAKVAKRSARVLPSKYAAASSAIYDTSFEELDGEIQNIENTEDAEWLITDENVLAAAF